MRQRPAYYAVLGFKDGTIYGAVQTRKPSKRSLYPGERIDQDGVYRWDIYDGGSFQGLSDREVMLRHVAMAGRLNTRRAIRELVLPRVEAMEKRLDVMQEQLGRIEALLGGQDGPQRASDP